MQSETNLTRVDVRLRFAVPNEKDAAGPLRSTEFPVACMEIVQGVVQGDVE